MKNQKQEKNWGKIANNFDDISEYVVGKTINKDISERLSKERNLGNVIEFGCGTGYFTRAMSENAKHIVATDVSDDMLEMAKNQLKNYGNITFKRADCKSNGFPDKEFDTVFMANLLHVIKDPHQALEESYRILKNNGLLIAVDLTGYGMKKFEMLKLGFRYLRKMGKPPKVDKGNLSLNDLESFAENTGFKTEENILLGNKVKAIYFKGVKLKRINPKLNDVPKTMLIPLRARYLESKRPDSIIKDSKSIEILDKINYNFSGKNEVSRGSQMGVAIRTEIFDEQTNIFLSKNKDAVVVNLGCGLDTRFHRLDNGSVIWFDLDAPEAIELRKNFFRETDRFKFISKSVLDFSWIEQIPKNRATLFIAEGLLMYFTEKEVKLILRTISKNFPKSEMLLEAMSPFVAKRSDKHSDVKKCNATFKWGIKTGKEIEEWDLGIKFLAEYYYFDRHKDQTPIVFRILSLIPAFRKMMKIIHIRFKMKGGDKK